jgi:hypothetical protein
MDDTTYAASMTTLRSIPRNRLRTLLLDYNDPAPGAAFDPAPGDRYSQGFEHWTAEGLALLAARLARDTRGLVREAAR